MKKYFIIFLFASLVISCSNYNAKKGRTITVTIEPLRFFTEQIAGDKFNVVTMVPGGASPETYEPTANQMVNLAQSDLYIKVGKIGFERIWMKKLKENAPHLIFIDSSDGISMIETSAGIYDPHVWTSPTNAKVIANNIYHSLCKIDAKDSSYFKHRLMSLNNKISVTDSLIRRNLLGMNGRSFLIYHPTLTYFAKDYHLCQIPLEEDGREPSASQLQMIINKAKEKGTKVMFIQKEFSSRNTSVISQNIGVKQLEINPLSYDWCKEMIRVSEYLKR